MQKVWIDEKCIACGNCVAICPEVFVLHRELAGVRPDADLALDAGIKTAAAQCTVGAIHYRE